MFDWPEKHEQTSKIIAKRASDINKQRPLSYLLEQILNMDNLTNTPPKPNGDDTKKQQRFPAPRNDLLAPSPRQVV